MEFQQILIHRLLLAYFPDDIVCAVNIKFIYLSKLMFMDNQLLKSRSNYFYHRYFYEHYELYVIKQKESEVGNAMLLVS